VITVRRALNRKLMATPILTTKLYIPPPQPKVVKRPRLVEQMNESLHRKLTLLSAPAGFGKTRLVSEWVAACDRPVAWLSLDEDDNDPVRFLTYLISALQTIAVGIGDGVLGALQSPQPPPTDSLLTALLNDIAAIPEAFIFILDDYHMIDTPPVDDVLNFLLEHLPPQMHLVITSREDPPLPLARLRARGQMTELRVTDLRFTHAEAAAFLNDVMDLELTPENIAALETRTEGWIAGLQLAALSMQGHTEDATNFIESFTGSHHFVLDYLVEEVLHQQPDTVQNFLLRTSILDRMCGPLCEAVLQDTSVDGQEALEFLEQANLFIVPLDNERRWYRYHHLFADLLRQRLQQNVRSHEDLTIAKLHGRASQWFEDHGLEIEAFQHAAAANDIERAERLIEGGGMPLHFRGGERLILRWLDLLPASMLNETPSLWTTYASVLLVTGQASRVEPTLQSAEAALQDAEQNEETRDLIGRVAAIRATLAAARKKVQTIIDQSERALEFLHPDNLAFRTSTNWKLGYAYHLQGDRAAARRAYREVIATGQATGNVIFTLMATIGLGALQLSNNNLHRAAETFHHVLDALGDKPLPVAGEVHLGMAQLYYEWNDLDSAEAHLQLAIPLAQEQENPDRALACDVFRARLNMARGDVETAVDILGTADQVAHQHKFKNLLREIAGMQVLTLLKRDNVAAARHLAEKHELPISQARVHLAQRNPTAALDVLASYLQEMVDRDWQDERLKALVLQAIAWHMARDTDSALQVLDEALTAAKPGGFIRLFVDEGLPMAQLLSEAAARGMMPDYINQLLDAFDVEGLTGEENTYILSSQPLIEPLSDRELEVLQLVAEGLSNREISERLFLALSTVKGHNQRIFGKLAVQRRTEAVARARELGLL
jgi:LuxR family maltose regulon positive regulatory protein